MKASALMVAGIGKRAASALPSRRLNGLLSPVEQRVGLGGRQ
jgi:hypothetical protein